MRLGIFKWMVIVAVMLGLSGCGESASDRTATVRFKTILALKVDGKIQEFSSVMQVKYIKTAKSTSKLGGRGGSMRMWGEAVVIDLGKRGKAYMLVSGYSSALTESFGIKSSLGSLTLENIKEYKSLTGRVPFKFTSYFDKIKVTYYPMIIAFKDENNPNSLYEVKRNDMTTAFSKGVTFDNVYLEISDEDITTGEVFEHLPWLRKKYKAGFERVPSNYKGSISKRPAKWRVNYNSFFAEESR